MVVFRDVVIHANLLCHFLSIVYIFFVPSLLHLIVNTLTFDASLNFKTKSYDTVIMSNIMHLIYVSCKYSLIPLHFIIT